MKTSALLAASASPWWWWRASVGGGGGCKCVSALPATPLPTPNLRPPTSTVAAAPTTTDKPPLCHCKARRRRTHPLTRAATSPMRPRRANSTNSAWAFAPSEPKMFCGCNSVTCTSSDLFHRFPPCRWWSQLSAAVSAPSSATGHRPSPIAISVARGHVLRTIAIASAACASAESCAYNETFS